MTNHRRRKGGKYSAIKRQRIGYYFPRKGTFIAITHALWESDAVITLSPIQRCILVDMLRKYYKDSRIEKKDLSLEGFTFSYRNCSIPCSDKSFYKALKEFVRRGLFELLPEHQREGLTAATRYSPTRKWKFWSDSEAVRRRDAKKQRRMNSWERRRSRGNKCQPE